jgi:hypothetical protein
MKAPIADQNCSITESLRPLRENVSLRRRAVSENTGYISPRSLPYELPERVPTGRVKTLRRALGGWAILLAILASGRGSAQSSIESVSRGPDAWNAIELLGTSFVRRKSGGKDGAG